MMGVSSLLPLTGAVRSPSRLIAESALCRAPSRSTPPRQPARCSRQIGKPRTTHSRRARITHTPALTHKHTHNHTSTSMPPAHAAAACFGRRRRLTSTIHRRATEVLLPVPQLVNPLCPRPRVHPHRPRVHPHRPRVHPHRPRVHPHRPRVHAQARASRLMTSCPEPCT